MDQVTLVKSEFRSAQWQRTIQYCQNSGQTVVSWCSDNGINIKIYYYWLRKLHNRTISETSVLVVPQPKMLMVFKKLEVSMLQPGLQAAVIIHLNSASGEISDGASRQTVEAVLLALKTQC